MEGVRGSSPLPPRPYAKAVFHVKHPASRGALLGIDVGTSGLKALLMAPSGRLLGSALATYPLDVPRPGWAEQDPRRWWTACGAAVRRVLASSRVRPGSIAGVGLTGQMHGSVFLDAAGRVLSPALLWCDQRTARECDEITRLAGGRRALLRLTCNPALTGFTAPKILWVRRHLPQVYRRIAKVLLPKDYVRYRLTGAFASDVADASGTLLFDVRRRTWSQPMLKALRFPPGWMPEAFEGPDRTGAISAEGARATGLLAGTPVVAGGGDQAAGAIGCGMVAPGLVSASLGTSGVVFAACRLPRRLPDGRLHLFCSAVRGGWHLMGVMLAAGGSLRWWRDTLAVKRRGGHDPYDAMCAEAARIPAGAEGLTFLPYLTGERTPHADPYARGVFFGLSLRHTSAHLTRAVLEGVGYGMTDSLDLMRAMGTPIRRVRLSGGGARSPLWCRIQAAQFRAPCATLTREEGPALGAAMLAGIGTGVYSTYEAAVRACVAERVHYRPEAALVSGYAAGHRRFQELYPAIRSHFLR